MWKYITLIILFLLVVGILLCYYQHRTKPTTHEELLSINNDGLFPGLVLFDIDNTLTTGNDNENVVQTVLNHGWAVGICTANPSYTMENIKNRSWMPGNLWQFIRKYNDITFNNVGSGFLMGKKNISIYKNLYTQIPTGIDIYGYRKGFALEKTGKALGIQNPKYMILCDDLNAFIKAAHTYNPNLTIVCSGADCGGHLTVKKIFQVLNSPS